MSSEARGAADRRRELVSRLVRQRGIEDGGDAVPRRADPSEHPLSFAQQRLWFLDQLEPESPRYNMFVAYRLEGTLDAPALERSLAEILRRHEVLRARFAAVDGEPRVRIDPPGPLETARHDLEGLDAAERDARVERLAMEQARRPYDLAGGPLARASLLRLGPGEHLLLLGMHHIASDGWSAGVLTRELCALYEAFSQGRPSPLPELKVQYADFAAWQRQWLRGQALDGQVAYWCGQLEGLTTLELPADRPRPPVQSFDGAWRFRALPPGLLEQVKELGQREGATLFMTLLAAYAVLLSRLSGQEDVAIGAPIANRTRAQLEDLIGFFANTLVLRTDLSGDPSFLELLRKVRETAVGAYAHQDLPFEKLVEELRPERHISRNPLFQVALVLQDTRPVEHRLPGLVLRAGGGVDNRVSKFDLTLYAGETEPGGLAFDYSTDLFDAATVDRMLSQLQTLLEAIVEAPDRRVADLPLLNAEEWRRTVREWNDTRVDHRGAVTLHEAVELQNATDREYARTATVVDLFREQARRIPEALAVDSGGETLSYGELDRRSSRLARILEERGVGAEAVVGLLTERSAEMVVGALGVLKAGAAYLPLDPAYPPDRLGFTLEDSHVGVVLTRERLLPRLPAGGWHVISLDGKWDALGEGDGEPARRGSGPQSLAYVIYTSGSTGQPKGVQLEHGGLSNLVHWHRRVFDVRPGDRATQVASPAFDASVWEMWPYLVSGASLHIPGEEIRSSPERLVAWLAQAGITHTFLPTPLAEAVLEEPEINGLGLRWLLTGGDKLHRRERKLPFRLANNYGPTEATVVATWTEVEPDGERDPPIGRPIDNTRAYVLDPAMRPVPVGVAGELYVGGDGLARGYPSHPELTAQRFVPDPFGSEPGARLYRTGDRVRFLADGRLEFLGRVDHQVKIRGFRIEPGEVEWVLRQHPRVRDVVVVVREQGGIEKRLVAYATSRDGQELVPNELQTWAREKLPGHMVPSALVCLEALPLSPNGKVDRHALPAPEATSSEAYEPPRTNAEEALARIWAEVLHLDRVSVHDNFFELGGDSILSIQIVSRANRSGLRLTLRQIFQHQTIASLAAAAQGAAPAQVERDVPIGAVPLTPIQRWFLDLHSEADPHHFNQAALLELQAEVPAARLEQATAALERHHDALRMRLVRSGAGWEQRCLEPGTPPPFLDLEFGGLGASRTAIEAAALEAQQSLDLGRGPLWRVVRIGRGASRPLLLVVIHHLVVDGVSWRVLLEDLQSACEQLARGTSVSFPPKTTSFRRWAERLGEHAQRGGVDQEIGYWRGVVDDGHDPLPVDHQGGRERNTVATAQHVSVTLDQGETRALLQEAPAAYRTRIGDLLLTALLEAFRGWTGRDTLLVDVEGHGREDLFAGVDLSRTVGWFTTIFPVRLAWTGGGPGQALKAVKEQLRQVPEGGIGFGLLRHLRGEDALRSPSEVLFNYLGQFEDAWGPGTLFAPAEIAAGPTRSDRQRRAHLIEVNGVVSGGRLHVDWLYSEAVHERATIEALARRFAEALRGLIEHCLSGTWGLTPSDFPLAKLDQAALDRVVAGRRQVEDVYPLSPMQEGLLFHALESPTEALYHEQGSYEFEGPLEAPALRRAWDLVMERHAILRTRFAWEGLERPLQVVERGLTPPWREEDWRGLGAPERERRFELLLREDRERGFDPTRAPLMRLCLVRLEDERHRLAWSFHHALLDGWSVPLVLQEVLELHRSYTRGGAIAAGKAQPFRRYIEWLSEQDLGAAERYWRAQLAGFRAPTPLGSSPASARVQATAGRAAPKEVGERLMAVDEESTERMKAFGRRHGVTLNTLVQGAWAVLLSRYSGERDVLFGVTVSGRPASLPGVERTIGLFINTLPLRVAVPAEGRVLEWLHELQSRQVEQRQYEYSPLWQVQQWSDVDGRRPLFESLLGFENYPVDPALRGLATDLRVTGLGIREATNYPLVVMAAVFGSRLYLRIVYDRERFDAAAITRLEANLGRILESLAARPDRRLGELSILGEEEDRRLLEEWNATAREYPLEALVHDRVAEQARRDPVATAVSDGRETLLYGELLKRADELAGQLRAQGIAPESVVAVYLERSAELVVALLGILRAGAAYLPLDTAYPRERVAFMLSDAGVRSLVTREELLGRLPTRRPPTICLPLDGRRAAPAAGLAAEASADGLAYVIYTSGSTGRPKAVELPHRGLANLVSWHVRRYDLGPGCRGTLVASPAFDAAVWEIWPYLAAGASLHVPDDDTRLTPARLAAWLRDTGVTHSFLPTPLAEAVLKEPDAVNLGLRALLTGGDKLHRVAPISLPYELVNHYGPTEATVVSTAGRVALPSERDPSIGRPIDNLRAYILDRDMNRVSIGTPGELYVGGVGLARGYRDRPDLTAEGFVPDPFGNGDRLYRTGDLGRHREDGSLEFLGRSDQQVKLRGHRVELGEIEATLSGHPAVRDAVVLVRPSTATGETRLVAYVVLGTSARSVGRAESGHVDQWRMLYDETYGRGEAEDAAFDITGWNSSYTDQPIPAAEMRAWVESACARILKKTPRRVLEIGCGTGLLLARIAPHCERYLGTDFSEAAVRAVDEGLLAAPGLDHVTVLHREAADFAGIDPASFDAVVLNSVVQYFPGIDYLLRVLEGAVEAVAPGGFVFVGDVRDLRLLEAFHTAVQVQKAPSALAVEELRLRISDAMRREEELLLDPALFPALRRRIPRIRRVSVKPKRGRLQNEIYKFRYDVELEVECAFPDPAEGGWAVWGREVRSLDELRLRLQGGEALRLMDVPSARVRPEVEAVRRLREGEVGTAGELREALDAGAGGVDPEELWALGDALGVPADVGWWGPDGRFRAVFGDGGLPLPDEPERPWPSYANDPLRGGSEAELLPQVREHLQTTLPEYMVPSRFVVLESLPLSPNGKVDRRALEGMDPGERANLDGGMAPRTPVEEAVAAVWREVLGLERVGVHQDFFEAGGHSLLATQVASRLREVFGVELPLRDVFDAPTVAGLSERVERLRSGKSARVTPPLRRAGSSGERPLSFAQQRLWTLEQLKPGTGAYTVCGAARLEGPLRLDALERALGEIVRRHEALRTTVVRVAGEPVPRVAAGGFAGLQRVDLAHVPENARDEEAERLAREEARRGFDLERGPLFRATLLGLGPERSVLVLSLHHIVSDGWSLGVLVRELSALYAAFSEGDRSPLPELPVQYGDFAAWQRGWLRGEVLAAQLEYWRTRLAGLDPLELPTDRRRPPLQTFRGGREVLALGPDVRKELRSLCRSEGATPFMVLLAAFQALLQRYAGRDDIPVGTPIANRNHKGIEELIGFFVNTLVLRADLAGDPSFRELLRQVKESCLAAFDHQDLPFERLVEELNPERDLSRGPLVQVAFAVQNAPLEPLRLRDVRVTPLSWGLDTTRFDLELHWWDRPDALVGTLVYNRDLWEARTASRMLRHFETLLRSALSAPGRRLSALRLLDGDERRRILNAGNRTPASYPADSCIHTLIEAQAHQAPAAAAVRFGDESLSYGDLDRRADRLARRLRSLGVGPESLVGLCLERSTELVVALLGILKAGGAYVPLDPSYPAERLRFMVEDCRPAVVVTEPGLEGRLAEGVRLVHVDRDDEKGAAETSLEGPAPGPDNAAYVIYTSGSSGRPKGVVVPHRGLANMVTAQAHAFGVTPRDRVLQFSSISFDASTFEIVMALTTGASLWLAPPVALPGSPLLELLREHEISIVTLPPSVLAMVPAVDLPSLRIVTVAGEACSPTLVETWAPGRRFFNLYGPTETTIWATFAECFPGAERPPIGRPIQNVTAYVLDRRMEPVPVGIPGELCVGGAGVTRGYLGRPDLTAERYVPDPFGSDPGARLYRTGDLVRWSAEGRLEFLGRIDHQVKLRGFRVELGEIESALSDLEGVRDSVVVVREDRPGDKRLVAYVAPLSGEVRSGAALREALKLRLPGFMVPAAIVRLDSLPLTANGKVDRGALPAPGSAEEVLTPPRDETERTIATVWAEVLGRESVGIHSSFFDLGGNSLLLVKAHDRLLTAFPENGLLVLDFFRYPTVAGLAERVRGGAPAAASGGELPERLDEGGARLRRRRAIARGAVEGRSP